MDVQNSGGGFQGGFSSQNVDMNMQLCTYMHVIVYTEGGWMIIDHGFSGFAGPTLLDDEVSRQGIGA